MSPFCQSLTEKHFQPRFQGIELSKDIICTKYLCDRNFAFLTAILLTKIHDIIHLSLTLRKPKAGETQECSRKEGVPRKM